MNSVLPNDLHDVEIVATFSEPLEQRLTLMLDKLPSGAGFSAAAKLVFEGVRGHFLEHELRQNVIHELCEQSLEDIVLDYGWVFELGRHQCWPAGTLGTKSNEDVLAELSRRGCRAFRIDSSLGLAGFVLANSIRLERRA